MHNFNRISFTVVTDGFKGPAVTDTPYTGPKLTPFEPTPDRASC